MWRCRHCPQLFRYHHRRAVLQGILVAVAIVSFPGLVLYAAAEVLEPPPGPGVLLAAGLLWVVLSFVLSWAVTCLSAVAEGGTKDESRSESLGEPPK